MEVSHLISKKKAYYCFCSERRLDLVRREALRRREIPKYDNCCRTLTNEEVQAKLDNNFPCCVRFKLEPGTESWEDLVLGRIGIDIASLEGDPVVLKQDGYPTYHLACVVDDHLMGITHVLRGVEWQASTPKHLAMYRALGWNPPTFAHLPLLVNPDGTKLSKRQGDIQISEIRKKDPHPLPLLNLLVSAGGGFTSMLVRGQSPKLLSLQDMIQWFDVKQLNSNSVQLDLNMMYIMKRQDMKRRLGNVADKEQLIKEVLELVHHKFHSSGMDSEVFSSEYVERILLWSQERIHNISDLIDSDMAFLWLQPSLKNVTKQVSSTEIDCVLNLCQALEVPEERFNKECLLPVLQTVAKEVHIPFSKLMKFLRATLSGLEQGPAVTEIMELLGKKRTLERLCKLYDYTQEVKQRKN